MPRHTGSYHCAVEATVDVIGGKWKPVIVFHLLSGAKRFGQLRRILEDVSQRSLTLQLRELEQDGIVRREVFAEVPPRVEYSLTKFGQTLSPLLNAMKLWGDQYIEENELEAPVRSYMMPGDG